MQVAAAPARVCLALGACALAAAALTGVARAQAEAARDACPDGRAAAEVPPELQPLVAALDARAGERLECPSGTDDLGLAVPQGSIERAIEQLSSLVESLAPRMSDEAPVEVRIASPPHAPPGGTVSVSAEAAPGARCGIEVRLPSGALSHAPGLEPRSADAAGQVSWSWQLGLSTRPGTGAITVACNGRSSSVPLEVE